MRAGVSAMPVVSARSVRSQAPSSRLAGPPRPLDLSIHRWLNARVRRELHAQLLSCSFLIASLLIILLHFVARIGGERLKGDQPVCQNLLPMWPDNCFAEQGSPFQEVPG